MTRVMVSRDKLSGVKVVNVQGERKKMALAAGIARILMLAARLQDPLQDLQEFVKGLHGVHG